MQTKHFDVSFEVKAVNDDGTLEGYGSVFGVKDSYSDVIQKGAFEASIKQHKANKSMPALLWQHDAGQPIGVWTEMSEDDNGLKVKGRLAMDTEKGKEAYALLKMGAISGMSIGSQSTVCDGPSRGQAEAPCRAGMKASTRSAGPRAKRM